MLSVFLPGKRAQFCDRFHGRWRRLSGEPWGGPNGFADLGLERVGEERPVYSSSFASAKSMTFERDISVVNIMWPSTSEFTSAPSPLHFGRPGESTHHDRADMFDNGEIAV